MLENIENYVSFHILIENYTFIEYKPVYSVEVGLSSIVSSVIHHLSNQAKVA